MNKKYICPCCGLFTFDSLGDYEICPVCNWENDRLQAENADYKGGANHVSLNEARRNFASFGQIESVSSNQKNMIRMENQSMFDVKGKWAFITGASRGIGYLSAEFMASCGCNLIVHAREIKHCDRVVAAAEYYGVNIHVVEAELSDLDAVNRMLEEIDAVNVPVDIVLNNAGLQIAYRVDYFETPVSDYIESFKINTLAPAMICYHFMPKMIERGYGRIVNTTSGIALEPQQAGYSASKAALDKITIDLGSTVEGSNVLINLADPGWCRTDLGGPNAPNDPKSTIPGIVLGAFVNDGKSGRIFRAQDYAGMNLEEAVKAAERG